MESNWAADTLNLYPLSDDGDGVIRILGSNADPYRKQPAGA
ncbi:MAG: hypothetical protein PSX80_03145 [bacterium]|nr:hypothetical protein [bacterium]